MEYDKDPKHILLESVNEEGLDYKRPSGRPLPPAGPTTTAKAAFAIFHRDIC